MALPARRKPLRSGIARAPERSIPSHRSWVRGHGCLVAGCESRDIEAAHVRRGTEGGTSLKPHDKWAIPLCREHHAEQHRIGEESFERKYGMKMKESAEMLARTSPHRWRWDVDGSSTGRG